MKPIELLEVLKQICISEIALYLSNIHTLPACSLTPYIRMPADGRAEIEPTCVCVYILPAKRCVSASIFWSISEQRLADRTSVTYDEDRADVACS